MDNKQWQQLKDDYVNRLGCYLVELSAFSSLLERQPTAESLLVIQSLAHKLAGSGAAYGFVDLSFYAKTLELLLRDVSSSNVAGVAQALEQLIVHINNCIIANQKNAEKIPFNEHRLDKPLTPRPQVLVADDDPNVAIDLIASLIEEGFDVHFIEHITQLENAIDVIQPVAVVCDLIFPEGDLAGVEYFEKINKKYTPPLPVIFISSEEGFDARLACARAGGSHFFCKPIDKVALARSLRDIIGINIHDPYRILLVDDDESLLQLYSESLENAGYSVYRAATAREGLQLLASEDPEMILLDIHLPDCNGLELGKIIRQHERFMHTPLLFMSSDTRADIQLAAVRLAGDEFISKPIEPWRLLMAVEPRVKRSRLMRNPACVSHVGMLNKGDVYDPLTALPNTRFLRSLLDEKLNAGDDKLQLCLMKVDIDDWEISHCLHPDDVLSREGGDEFYVLLVSAVSIQNQKAIVQKISTAIGHITISANDNLSLTVSVGIALAPQDSINSIDLMAHADTALFHAKSKKDSRVCYYDADIQKNMLHQFKLENDVKHIFERRELVAYYQPIFAVHTQQLLGFEALVRWRHPERGLVSPDQFMFLIEKQGLMPQLTEWILKTAIQQTVAWHQQGCDVMMNVNITALDVQNNNFVSVVNNMLTRYRLPPQKLMLELTESTLMLNWEQGGKLLGQLRALGIQLAIDDFGTGYSSLSYLNRFPVDKLKIDRSFLADWMTQKDERLISAIISLSKAMGFGVVAEGVEHQVQLNFLQRLGCDQFQGYLMSKPMPVADIGGAHWFKVKS
jgi:EAL domain-containing protein (putative c-di-GMP-specific phosphodiesterase class I)/PleD family two-component response regulator